MRVVVDTNVFVSVIVFESKAMEHLLVTAAQLGDVFLSEYIRDELIDVVVRKFPHKVRSLLKFLDKLNYKVLSDAPDDEALPDTQIADVKDVPILRVALYHKIDVLVTGDKHFRGIELPNLKIMTPAQFVAEYGDPGS